MTHDLSDIISELKKVPLNEPPLTKDNAGSEHDAPAQTLKYLKSTGMSSGY